MEAFRLALQFANLNDVGFKGRKFTWTNGRAAVNNVQERLDRFVANDSWLSLYPHYQVHHLVRYGSDHCPILL